MSFSKGPWESDIDGSLDEAVVRSGPFVVCCIYKYRDEWEANSKLISAAPDLLESLKYFVYANSCKNGCDRDDMTCETSRALAAIKKAEGQ